MGEMLRNSCTHKFLISSLWDPWETKSCNNVVRAFLKLPVPLFIPAMD